MASLLNADHERILSARGLRKRFDGVVALDGLDIDIEGGITGIVGPNGAGKTTLFDVLSGFSRPDSGSVLLYGRRVDRWPPYRLARQYPGITRSFQEIRLFEEMTVLDNLLVARKFCAGTTVWGVLRRLAIRRELREEVNEVQTLLRLLDLAELQERRAHELSYGQRKLLEIGRCLAAGSHLTLLDEPFAGVNPHMIELICRAIKEAHDGSQKAFLLVDHNHKAMESVCDRILRMEQGRVIGAATGGQAHVA